MEKPMAKNLLKAGYELVVFDINKSVVEELTAIGAKSLEITSGIASKTKYFIQKT